MASVRLISRQRWGGGGIKVSLINSVDVKREGEGDWPDKSVGCGGFLTGG